MRIALLGIDDESLTAARAGVDAGMVVVAMHGERGLRSVAESSLPGAIWQPSWETMLVGKQVDAILVARTLPRPDAEAIGSPEERREEQLRRCMQEQVPIIVFPPACRLDFGYELEVYRRDQQGVILPWIPNWHHPAWKWLDELLGKNSPLGSLEQFRWERFLVDRSRVIVLRELTQDLAVMRRHLGAIRTVTATASHAETHYDPFAPRRSLPPLDQLQVQLGTNSNAVVRWSVMPATTDTQATITLLGSQGRAELQLRSSPQPWTAWKEIAGERQEFNWPTVESLWQPLSEAVQKPQRAAELFPTWLDQCRDLEAIEALDRSLLKGRSVAIHAEETTEEEAFKGTMASVGCLVLLFVLLILVGVLFVEGLRLPIRNWVLWRYWPVGLVSGILVFLLAQSLSVVVQKRNEPRDED